MRNNNESVEIELKPEFGRRIRIRAGQEDITVFSNGFISIPSFLYHLIPDNDKNKLTPPTFTM